MKVLRIDLPTYQERCYRENNVFKSNVQIWQQSKLYYYDQNSSIRSSDHFDISLNLFAIFVLISFYISGDRGPISESPGTTDHKR